MKTESLLNFSQLLKPISKAKPVGDNLREDISAGSLYQQIKDARNSARAIERQRLRMEEAVSNKEHWQKVYQLAIEILAHHSKDLEVTAWLLEALLREQGFSGLQAGIKLTVELINKFWDSIYPLPDAEEEPSSKLQPLLSLSGEETEGTLIIPIAMIPLTAGQSKGPYALWQYQQALEINKIADEEKRRLRIAANGTTLADIAIAVSETPKEFFQKIIKDMQNCIANLLELHEILTKKLAQQAPTFSRLHKQLENCLACVKAIAAEKTLINEPMASIAVIEKSVDTAGTLNNRDEVLKILLQAADFFRRTEPHSPISYMLERIVRWGKLPFPELLKELISNQQIWNNVCQLMGVNNS